MVRNYIHEMEIIHHHFEVLPSTNDYAKEKLETLSPDSVYLFTADTQTRGRGRFGRTWLSPSGLNFCGSFAFFLNQEQEDPLVLTHLLACTVASYLESLKLAPRIKWPNDLFVEGKKIGGILCETKPHHSLVGVIIGLGLNVNMTSTQLSQVDQPATSLLVETTVSHDIKSVIDALKVGFGHDLELFLNKGFFPFQTHFNSLLISKN